MFKVGDKVVRTGADYRRVKKGEVCTVEEDCDHGIRLMGKGVMYYSHSAFKLVEPNHHPHHDLIIAWAKGAEIQQRFRGDWVPALNPSWDPDKEYRIRPSARESEIEAEIQRLTAELAQLRST